MTLICCDVLKRLLSHVLKEEIELTSSVFLYALRYADATMLR